MKKDRIVNVEMSTGYLVLRGEKSIELFEAYVEEGTIWEFISTLFNEHANKIESEKQVEHTEAVLSLIMKELKDTKRMLSALPPPTTSSHTVKVDTRDVIQPASIEIKEVISTPAPAKSKGGLKGMLNNFNKMKG